MNPIGSLVEQPLAGADDDRMDQSG
jgi:hypothetical protein